MEIWWDEIMEMINVLWGLFICAAFVVGFVVGSKVAEKEERRLFDVYKCFNDCKYRNDPNYVMPIKLDDFFKQKNTNRGMTRGGMVEPLFPFNEETAPISKEAWDSLYPKVRDNVIVEASINCVPKLPKIDDHIYLRYL